jgi:hypothetical protein
MKSAIIIRLQRKPQQRRKDFALSGQRPGVSDPTYHSCSLIACVIREALAYKNSHTCIDWCSSCTQWLPSPHKTGTHKEVLFCLVTQDRVGPGGCKGVRAKPTLQSLLFAIAKYKGSFWTSPIERIMCWMRIQHKVQQTKITGGMLGCTARRSGYMTSLSCIFECICWWVLAIQSSIENFHSGNTQYWLQHQHILPAGASHLCHTKHLFLECLHELSHRLIICFWPINKPFQHAGPMTNSKL